MHDTVALFRPECIFTGKCRKCQKSCLKLLKTELLGILAVPGPFAFKPSKALYNAYSKLVIIVVVTIKTDHFINSITYSSFLLNHDLINVFLFTIMLTQCVLHTLDLFYILSNRWSNLLQSCAHCSCSWHLASPSCCDRRQDPFEMRAELLWYLWKYICLKHKHHLVFVVGSEWEAMLLPYHWQISSARNLSLRAWRPWELVNCLKVFNWSQKMKNEIEDWVWTILNAW